MRGYSKSIEKRLGGGCTKRVAHEPEAPVALPCEPSTVRATAPSPDASSLSPKEIELVACLLSSGSVREFERAHACMASVLVDSINDKLYDEFADICIDATGDEPAIIEDYAPELRTLLGLS